MKKLFVLMLALALMMNGVSLAESIVGDTAVEYRTYQNFEYVCREDGTACLTRYTGSDANVTLPAKIGGYPLTEIGEEAFADDLTLQRLTVPSGVTAIRARAFYNCSALKSIELPDTLEAIESYAFTWCESLTSLEIPTSVHAIGLEVFSCCQSLVLTVERGSYAMRWCMKNDIPYNCGVGKTASFDYTVLSDDSVSITDYIGTATEISIPAELDGHAVSAIASGAFSMSASLKSVVIPEGVTSIGDEVFASCGALTDVTMPSSITAMGTGIFAGCNNVTLTVDAGSAAEALARGEGLQVKYIEYTCGDFVYTRTADGGAMILRCTSVAETIDIPAVLDGYTVYSAVSGAFAGNTTVKRVNVSFTVDSLGDAPFEGCTALEYISVSPDNLALADIDGVLYIKSGRVLSAYPAGRNDTSFDVPEGILTIGKSAFSGAGALLAVKLPTTLTAIDDEAFRGCIAMTRAVIPASVASIGEGAYAGCASLKTVEAGESLVSIGACAFEDCQSLISLTLPKGLTSVGSGAFRACVSLTEIVFPEGVGEIGEGTFEDCAALTSFAVPEGAASIGAGAFRGCAALASAVIPDSVTAIGEAAFEGCGKLQLTVGRGSTARDYAQANGIDFIYPDSYDWLNG